MTDSQSSTPAALERALAGLTLGEPVSWHGLTLFPLLGNAASPPAYDSLGAALAAGTFRITEVSESGVVGRLRAVNRGPRPVLLLDGEEVVGAKQNRVLNITIVVPAHTELEIPVSCVEQGRWSAKSAAFSEAGRALHATARRGKAAHVTESLRRTGHAVADQGEVWHDVAARLQELNVPSATYALAAAYEGNRASLSGYVERFPPMRDQVGGVYTLAGDVIGLECFDTPAAFAAAAPKLVQSYAMDLLGREPADAAAAVAEARSLLDEVRRAPVTEHPATGLGRHLRIGTDALVGGALALDDVVIHLFAFRRQSEPTPRPRRRPEPRAADSPARDLIRRGQMHCRDADTFGQQPTPLSASPARLRDRVHGMLLGLAIGDALGNTTEGMLPAERRARLGEIRDYLPHPHAGNRPVGLPSDDSQLAFWTVRRLLEDGALLPERLAAEFSSRRIFGIGSAVRAFIRTFKDEGVPWEQAGQASAGNGALMRIAPVLLPHLRAPSPRLWSDAAVAGMVTHNDPASIGSCVAFTAVLWQLLRMRRPPQRGWWLETFVRTLRAVEGDVARYRPRTPHLQGATSLWEFTQTHVGRALAEPQPDTLAALDRWYSGAYLLETVPSVLYILERHGHDPEEAIVRAVNDTRDNDTIAAIVGAAVGALHGLSALPERWVRGLLGRTGEADDGEVFRLVSQAAETFVPDVG